MVVDVLNEAFPNESKSDLVSYGVSVISKSGEEHSACPTLQILPQSKSSLNQ